LHWSLASQAIDQRALEAILGSRRRPIDWKTGLNTKEATSRPIAPLFQFPE